MQRSACSLAVWICVLGACGDDAADVPAAPQSGIPITPGRRDSGVSDDRDAGAAGAAAGAGARGDAGAAVATNCERITALHTDADDAPGGTSTQSPADFNVTRQAQTWTVDDCATPRFTVQLGGGSCAAPSGQQLAIAFDLNALDDGAIHPGNNLIQPDSDSLGIRVRYLRPRGLIPSGTWGTCVGVSGLLVFVNAPTLAAGAELNARYELTLTACDGSSAEPQFVVGSFTLTVRDGVGRFCPARAL